MTTLEAYVARIVAEAPPLTAEQRDRIAMLLRGGVSTSPRVNEVSEDD
jgi:hypothetical protein